MSPDLTRQLDEAVANCMKCGFCKAACPLFLGDETTTPRAKVRLARAAVMGDIGLTDRFRDRLDLCLNCKACAVECPSGVEPNRIALAVRAAFVEREGLPLGKRVAFDAMLRPKLMAIGVRAAGLAQYLTGIDLQNNPLRSLLPHVGIRRDRDFPVLGRRSLMSTVPDDIPALGQERTTVAYFPGCAANLLYPEIGRAAINILRKLGARVLMPHDLVCCGTPVFNSGDLTRAQELADRNIHILSALPAEWIVTSCGSCGLTISREWQETLGVWKAGLVAGKVLDISQFVARYAPDRSLQRLDESDVITYHDSCHLNRGMGVRDEPRQLLREVLGERFIEMELSDRCCGGGGLFCLTHAELSQEVAEVKMGCIERCGANTVATGCPACVMQLRDSFVHRQMGKRTVHTVEIIDRALRPA